MKKIKFNYSAPTFSSKISAEAFVLDTTKYYLGDKEVEVQIVYYNGFIHHIYKNESIQKIEVKNPR